LWDVYQIFASCALFYALQTESLFSPNRPEKRPCLCAACPPHNEQPMQYVPLVSVDRMDGEEQRGTRLRKTPRRASDCVISCAHSQTANDAYDINAPPAGPQIDIKRAG
jgi:hypothetical protein